MSLVYQLNGSTLPTSRVFYNYQGAEDWEMSQDATGPGGGQGTVVIQDPTGDLTVRTWMPFTVEESSSSQPRLVTSWITKVTERRGLYQVGVGREFVCELADPNVLLGLRLIMGRDGIRPSETDTARLAWLIGSDYLDGIVFDTGYINGNGTTFDAVDYRGQFATDVLNDLSRGRIYFAFWDPAALKVGLFFDLPDTTIWTSTISVSNVASDVNSTTTFALSDDATWERDGVGVYSMIRYVYLGAALTVTNPTTAATFFPSPLLERGETVETPNVGKTATAAIQAGLLLAQASDEEKTLKGRIWLPKEEAGLFLAGQRASFRASHFTGLTSATYLHLKRVTYKPWADHPGYYEVNFEASNFGIIGGGGSSGPPVPPQPSGTPGVVQTGCGFSTGTTVSLTFPAPITAGHMLVAWIVSRGSSTALTPPDGSWTTLASGDLSTSLSQSPVAMYAKIADGTEDGQTFLSFDSSNGSSRPKILGWELSGVAMATHTVASYIQTGTSGSLPSLTMDGAGINIIGIGTGSDNPSPASITPEDHFYIEGGDGLWQTALGADDAVSAAGSQVYSFAFTVSGGGALWDGAAAFFPASDTSGTVKSGSPVIGEVVATGDGTTTSFTTDFSFVVGSLKVYVDKLDQTGAVTASDGEAMTFTLGFAPQLGEQITVDYIKAP